MYAVRYNKLLLPQLVVAPFIMNTGGAWFAPSSPLWNFQMPPQSKFQMGQLQHGGHHVNNTHKRVALATGQAAAAILSSGVSLGVHRLVRTPCAAYRDLLLPLLPLSPPLPLASSSPPTPHPTHAHFSTACRQDGEEVLPARGGELREEAYVVVCGGSGGGSGAAARLVATILVYTPAGSGGGSGEEGSIGELNNEHRSSPGQCEWRLLTWMYTVDCLDALAAAAVAWYPHNAALALLPVALSSCLLIMAWVRTAGCVCCRLR